MELLLLAVAAVLVNNFVLTQFLGLCPFLGVSRRIETAAGMAMATAFVLTLASLLSHLTFVYILVPLGAEYLRTPAFILIIAVAVQLTEMAVRFTSPMLQQVLGLYLPLITTNCAVLGVALLSVRSEHELITATVYGAAAAAGFGLVLVIFAALRERLESAQIPKSFRGAPIALVSAGILAMGFMGFAGLAHATERELIGEREAMLEAEVTTLAVSEQAGPVPVVLLRELESERIVPIFIGENEARAIHSALHGLRPPRPMTHDLLAALIESTESELQAVIIDGLLDSAFIAVLELRVVGREALVYVDSRASDAIALALRTEASIYVSPEVMERATEFEEFERIEEPPRLERHEI